jgi:hypothetical protein
VPLITGSSALVGGDGGQVSVAIVAAVLGDSFPAASSAATAIV